MKRLFLMAVMGATTISPAFAAELNDEQKNALKAAFETGNGTVLDATLARLKASASAEDVNAYMEELENPTPAVTEEEMQKEAEAIWQVWSPSLWSGSAELGVDIQNGNTDRRAFNGALNLKRSTEEWNMSAHLKGKSVREDKVRTEEKYEIGGEADYKLTQKSFVFGDVEYVNDPFSGLNYRFTETVGYGRNVLTSKTMKWDVRAGLGGRHSEATSQGAERQDEFIFRPSTEFDWKISDAVSFNQKLSSTMGGEIVITESTSSLKSKLAEDWFFKVEVDIEHLDQVEQGKKNTDTATTLNLVYEF